VIRDNPFFVLGVAPDASRIAIEREAQKLLGMLELGFATAQTYPTPLGPAPRTAEAVRAAVAALRDPARRLVAELWARHAPPPPAGPAGSPPDREAAGGAGPPAPSGEAPPPAQAAAPGSPPTGAALRRALGWPP
jgi:hypothetical protein